jgi:hypothetical protein
MALEIAIVKVDDNLNATAKQSAYSLSNFASLLS